MVGFGIPPHIPIHPPSMSYSHTIPPPPGVSPPYMTKFPFLGGLIPSIKFYGNFFQNKTPLYIKGGKTKIKIFGIFEYL